MWLIGAAGTWLLLDSAYTPSEQDVRPDTFLQLIIFVAALPGYAVAAVTLDRLGRKFVFPIAYGVGYFFTKFGPNTTTLVYPAETFPVEVRTTAHRIAAAAGELGAFIGTFTLPLLAGFQVQGAQLVVAVVCAAGLAIRSRRWPSRPAGRVSGSRPARSSLRRVGPKVKAG